MATIADSSTCFTPKFALTLISTGRYPQPKTLSILPHAYCPPFLLPEKATGAKSVLRPLLFLHDPIEPDPWLISHYRFLT